MRVMFLSAPGYTPYIPPLAIAALSSYLDMNNIHNKSVDVSIELYHHLLAPNRLKKFFNPLYKILIWMLLVITGKFNTDMGKQLRYVMKHEKDIKRRISELRTPEGFNITKEGFTEEITLINQVLLYSTALYYPNVVALNATASKKMARSPYMDYYKKVLIPMIKSYNPDLIGVSISFEGQEHYAFEMMDYIKKELPGIPMVTGGAHISYLSHIKFEDNAMVIPVDSEKAQFVKRYLHPYAIQGEGEEPLLSLCYALENGDDLATVPGLIYLDEKNETITINRKNHPLRGTQLPECDFRDFPLGKKYLAPIVIAPLVSSRGCYWNKCTFCDHAGVLDNRFREIPPHKIIHNIEILKAKYDIDQIFFFDESMSPRMFKQITNQYKDSFNKVQFFTMIRFEEQLVDLLDDGAKAGFNFLAFGFESGSARILSKMKKGYKLDVAQNIINKCANNNILAMLFVMFGFPTETLDDANQTISFLRKNLKKITGYMAGTWRLATKSYIGKHLDEFGVEPLSDGYNTKDSSDYRIIKGINHDEALKIYNGLYSDPNMYNKTFTANKYHAVDFQFIQRIINNHSKSA